MHVVAFGDTFRGRMTQAPLQTARKVPGTRCLPPSPSQRGQTTQRVWLTRTIITKPIQLVVQMEKISLMVIWIGFEERLLSNGLYMCYFICFYVRIVRSRAGLCVVNCSLFKFYIIIYRKSMLIYLIFIIIYKHNSQWNSLTRTLVIL